MLTDPERGLTADAVETELEDLDLLHAEQRKDIAELQKAAKAVLTKAHKISREKLAKTQGAARDEVVILLAVLKREVADFDSDTVDAEPDAPADSS